jgi:hypothetical protein
VKLLYLSNSRYGGWVTFTTHLYHGLIGRPPQLSEDPVYSDNHEVIRVTTRTEKTYRNMGNHVPYRNMCETDILEINEPILITALDKNHRELATKLLEQGACIVIHDPTELRNPEFRELINPSQVVVIRKSMLEHMPEATFIPHPYLAVGKTDPLDIEEWKLRPHNAISMSRLDFDKNSHWLFEINRKVDSGSQIYIRGAENRMYTKNKIVPKYPEYKQDSNRPKDERAIYPLSFRGAYNLCKQAKYMTDFSVIKGDGGGTQYTFLEAIDAGAICLLHNDWIMPRDAMVDEGENQNCIAFLDYEQAANFLSGSISSPCIAHIRTNADRLLSKHDAVRIAARYVEFVG